MELFVNWRRGMTPRRKPDTDILRSALMTPGLLPLASRRTSLATRWLFAGWLALGLVTFGSFCASEMRRIDLSTLSCGARIESTGGDPYRAVTLAPCEHALQHERGVAMNPSLVWQAPLPPLILALAAPFAWMPTAAGDAVFEICAAIAVGLLAIVYARLGPAGRPAAFVLAAIPVGVHELARGQPAFVAITALALAIAAARSQRWWLCAAALFVAIAEPHLAFPAILGAVVALPRARLPIGVALAVFALGSVFAGVPLAFEYLGPVLRDHARSELFHVEQYSAAMPLALAGAAPDIALRIAVAQGALAIGLGVAIGTILARRWNDAAAAIAVPLAFGTLGGPFMHMTQLAAVFPLAILLLRHEPASRTLVFAAILPIALDPEDLLFFRPPLFLIYAAFTTLVLARSFGLTTRAQWIATATAPLVALLLHVFARPSLADVRPRFMPPFDLARLRDPATLADASAQSYVERAWNIVANPQHLWLNAVVWAGLALLAVLTARAIPAARRTA